MVLKIIKQAFKCYFGFHGKTVEKQFLGWFDTEVLPACEFCNKIRERKNQEKGYTRGG